MPYVSSVTPTSTGDDLIEEVLRLFLSGQREEMNKLAVDVPEGATSLTMQFDLGGILPNSLVNIDTETYRVWEVDDTSKTLTVEPAMTGSRSAPHDAGALVYVNPRLSRAAVFDAINKEILSLNSPSNGLYRMKTLEFPYQAPHSGYDLAATDLLDLYEVRSSNPGPERYWNRVTDWRFSRDADTSVFPSGLLLNLPTGLSGQTIQVLYKAPFDTMAEPGIDVQAATGMPPEMQDIIVLGVLLRLGPVREIKRNFTETQGESRRAGEVGSGTVTNSFGFAQAYRRQRINEEAARLAQRYPMWRK